MPDSNGRLTFPIGPSTGAGLLLCAASLIFGVSQDFGAFLLSMIAIPLLAVLVFVFLVMDVISRRRQVAAVGAILLIGSPACYIASAALRDPVIFSGWALTHSSIVVRPGPSRIVEHWDSWGMAGSENDSYLVVDQSRALGDAAGRKHWSRLVEQTCELVDVKRMWSSLYLVTTYNCPLTGFPF